MALLLAGFQVMLIVVARSIYNSNAFGQLSGLMPPLVRQMLGESMASFMSFDGIACLGYFHVAVMAGFVALSISLATIPASEIETGFIDLLLCRPVARQWIITRTIVLVVVCLVSLLVVMMAGTWTGLVSFAPSGVPWPTASLIFSIASNLGLLALCWSGVAMALGAASRRRGSAGAIAGLLALATFLLDYIARAWEPASHIGWLSPFRYYNPLEMLAGNPISVKNVVVLLAISVAGFAASYVIFSRRDISR